LQKGAFELIMIKAVIISWLGYLISHNWYTLAIMHARHYAKQSHPYYIELLRKTIMHTNTTYLANY